MATKTKSTTHVSRQKRSFFPEVLKPMHSLVFKGEGAKYIGNHEPEFPSAEVQEAWTTRMYEKQISDALNWYTATQDDKLCHKFAIDALGASKHFPELIKSLNDSKLPIPHTTAWLLRMAHRGFILRFKEKRFIVKTIRKNMAHLEHHTKVKDVDSTNKPTIQDHIAAKLHGVKGQIDASFDDFTETGYKKTKKTVISILLDPTAGISGAVSKQLTEYAKSYLNEFKLAASGKNAELAEAYNYLGKRGLKACIEWWEQAIFDIDQFSQHKNTTRKTRKRKPVSPNKIVGKLKFLRKFEPLKLESVEPTTILKSSELWIFNTKTRKIGHYVTLPGTTFDVKSTRLLNLDTTKCVQKTLRKPVDQLKQFNNFGKPGAVKWFQSIHAVATPLREAINADSILLRVVK